MVGNSVGTVAGAVISPLDGGATMRRCANETADAACNWADNVKGHAEMVVGGVSGNMGGDEGTDDMRQMNWFERLCAQASRDVYKIKWSVIDPNKVDASEVPRGYGEWRRTAINFPYYMLLEKENEALLVLRGTDLVTGLDAACDATADLNIVVCGLVSIGDTVRGVQCSNMVQKLLNRGKKVHVTGHSLGGGVAWYLCYAFPQIEGIAFNPPAGPRPTPLSNLYVHCNGWDPISWKWVWNKMADKHYNSGTSADGECGHFITSFYGLPDKDKDWQ